LGNTCFIVSFHLLHDCVRNSIKMKEKTNLEELKEKEFTEKIEEFRRDNNLTKRETGMYLYGFADGKDAQREAILKDKPKITTDRVCISEDFLKGFNFACNFWEELIKKGIK